MVNATKKKCRHYERVYLESYCEWEEVRKQYLTSDLEGKKELSGCQGFWSAGRARVKSSGEK